MDTNGKLKFTEKLAYGLADFPEAANSILEAFLTMFYTDNIGMAAGAVGTMFFISKLFDGVSDILAGSLIDRTKTKWGKARPWLLWLAVPTGLALALIFWIPVDASPTAKMAYAFVSYNLFTAVMFTITGIARSLWHRLECFSGWVGRYLAVLLHSRSYSGWVAIQWRGGFYFLFMESLLRQDFLQDSFYRRNMWFPWNQRKKRKQQIRFLFWKV